MLHTLYISCNLIPCSCSKSFFTAYLNSVTNIGSGRCKSSHKIDKCRRCVAKQGYHWRPCLIWLCRNDQTNKASTTLVVIFKTLKIWSLSKHDYCQSYLWRQTFWQTNAAAFMASPIYVIADYGMNRGL